MVARVSRRSDLVARVDPDLCVSCGICAGSCAPMGVGPPGRTGATRSRAVHEFLAAPGRRAGEVIVDRLRARRRGVCRRRARRPRALPSIPIDCAGNLHTSVIEMLLRGGAGGVLVLACPAARLLESRGAAVARRARARRREAELQARVDRARVRIVHVGARERGRGIAALRAFAADVAPLGPPRQPTRLTLKSSASLRSSRGMT